MRTFKCFLVVTSLAVVSTSLHAQWIKTNGPNTGPVQAIIIFGDSVIAGTNRGGIHRSREGGMDWTHVDNNPTRRFVFSLAVSHRPVDTLFLAGTFNGGIHLSGDLGTTWSSIAYNSNLAGSTINSIVNLDVGELMLGANPSGVHVSTDNGASWEARNSGLTNTNILGACHGDPYSLVATTNGVFISTDKGHNWVSAGLGGKYVNTIAISGQQVFAGTQLDGVYNSEVARLAALDTTWGPVNNGLKSKDVKTLLVFDRSLFSGASDGVYVLSPYGADPTTWVDVTAEMSASRVQSLAASSRLLYAGTEDGYVHHRLLSSIFTSDVEADQEEVPTKIVLHPISPNPFTSSTAITFSIPSRSPVRLSICDALGREVAILVDEVLSPGIHMREWNVEGHANGVYRCLLEVGMHRESASLVLAR